MDDALYQRLKKIEDHIESLKTVEERFLRLSAHERVLFAKLYLGTCGGSIEERKARVHASKDWADFIDGLVEAETAYLEAKRRYELKLKAYDAEHLTFKNQVPAIRRQP